MAGKNTIFVVEAIVITILVFIPRVFSDDSVPIPADKSQLNSWFQANIKPLETRKDTLDPALVAAEANKTIIKIKADGSGDFKTLTDAINSIPEGNKRRVIISTEKGGNYTEKIKIERTKPFITLYGDPKDVPNIIFNGTAKKYGTVDSATVIVESEYFSAVNINFVNSAPRPDGKAELAQAAALRTGGDKASLYNCKMYGFQDTFCDDNGKHFFKDCYVEGTVDFIFGNAKSLYLNTELHVIPGDQMAMITAHARGSGNVDSGYSFVHCMITGTGNIAFLGRAWRAFSKVVFSYTDMSDVVNPQGWSDNGISDNDRSVFFGEFKCKGAGSVMNHRAGFVRNLTDPEAKPFITLGYIEGSKWLLPPVAL